MGKAKGSTRQRERWQRYMVGINQTLAPGEKTQLSTQPLNFDFRFDYAIVPDAIAFDDTKPRLLFHHDQLVDKKVPASVIFSAFFDHQKRDFFQKQEFVKGEVFVLGTFENVSARPLEVRAAVVGYAKVEG